MHDAPSLSCRSSRDRTLARRAISLIIAATLVRLAIVLLSPFELASDEAQYWDWSRRLDLSYYSKGPGVAWTIAISTAIFGESQWAIRLPAVLSGTITLICGAWLAMMCFPNARGKSAWFTVLALCAIPALHGASVFMTIDAPYVASWGLACALAWRLWSTLTGESSSPGSLALQASALGLALGASFLYKYTALILPAGLLCFVLFRRGDLRSLPRTAFAVAITTFVFAICTLPVFIWNAQHDWPTVHHLMGHLGMAGGDVPIATNTSGGKQIPWWTIEYLAGQLGVVGPLFVLMVIASMSTIRKRRADVVQWPQHLFLLLCGWPVFIFYLVISFFTDIEANWPMAGVVTLAVLASQAAIPHLDLWRERVIAWRALPAPRPRAGFLVARPESLWQMAWHASIGFGVAGLIILGTAPWIAQLPGIGKYIPLSRVSGGGDLASAVTIAMRDTPPTSPPPRIIAKTYGTAARLAYYLTHHPSVSCASAFVGDRASGYDHFADTRLDDPAFIGQNVILVGGSMRKWQRSRLDLADLRMVDENHRIAIARFVGLRDQPPEPISP